MQKFKTVIGAIFKNIYYFYCHYYLQSFKQHVFEPDPERVKQIIDKSLADAEWIFKKVLNVYFFLTVNY